MVAKVVHTELNSFPAKVIVSKPLIHGAGQPYSCVGLARTIYIRYFWQGISPDIRSYTVYIYGAGQPYSCVHVMWTKVNFCWFA